MTTRKLTPAEALEVFRDWRAVERADMTSTAFYDKWGTSDSAVSDAIDAIGEALAQKPTAAVVEIVDGRVVNVTGNVEIRGNYEEKPSAPVPSDEEIVESIRQARAMDPAPWTMDAVALLARRIGVQGVPQ